MSGADERVVREELASLERVRTLLQEEPYVLPPSEAQIVAELVRLREELPKAKDEDAPALLQQYDLHHAWLEQVRAARARPEVDPDSPYFAHLRLEEDGRTRDVFLGKATRIARGIRIVDWRHAPVSRLFYAYQQGDEYEEPLGDRVHSGEVTARRTVTIRSAELLRVDAPEGSWVREPGGDFHALERSPPKLAGGQGTALRAHEVGHAKGRRLGTEGVVRADKHLPDIAGLIDPEQFELVTRPSSGFVVVRGTAGSGKTTVALHRIAWLAYSDPGVNSDRTLVLVFSPALREYVSHVLPALGVARVRIRDYREWASDQRRRHFPQLPRKTREDTPAVVVRLKLHPAMHDVLAEQVRRSASASDDPDAEVPEVVPGAGAVWDDVVSALTDVELLGRVLGAIDPGAFTEEDLRRVATWVRDRAAEVVARAEGDTEADPALDLEDDALLLHAWQLRVGPLRTKKGAPLRYRHVAVDEVQDFSPLEIRVLLGCLDERQSITLAGDTQQHVMKEAGFTSWSGFLRQLGVDGTHVDTLRVAYRSTRPIVSFALDLLGDLLEDEPPLVTRDGPPVELFRFTDHGQAVAFLGDALKELVAHEPMASVALLAPDDTTAALYAEGLRAAEVPRLRRVIAHDFTFAPGVEVATMASVKGLEFDY
ncbi:MAG: AAA family ATPase, partial [Myxococcales bacterium]|nr:AAA family ATPase [Myxococcales bacterium]